MQCPECSVENKPERKFCSACGHALPSACQACGFANDAGDEFCGGCGRRLAHGDGPRDEHAVGSGLRQPGASSPARQPQPAYDAERRQLTVMFCDLVDSTALSARLDPEQLREVVRAFQTACGEVIARFDGYVAQYLGDGLLVYFGHPQAHEDDAQRAVRAGLSILSAMGALNARPDAPAEGRLSIRVGIHTGLVVVGEVGSRERHEHLALGETPNLAFHVQALAEPDTLAISAATLRLVRGLFVSDDLGEHALKGVPAPLHAYRVLGESGARSSLDAAAAVGLTPLVGREQEVGLLLDRWAQVVDGEGHVVLVTGDAGIGKSRLVQVLMDRVAGGPQCRLELRCSAYYANSPLYPVIEFLPRVLDWSRDDPDEVKLGKLESFALEHGVSVEEGLPLLASLLSLRPSERLPLPPMSPERQKERTLQTLLAMVLALAAEEPVLVVVEDLHWIDPTTAEFLRLLIDQGPTPQLFCLLTARLQFQPAWAAHSHVTSLTLTRFTQRQTESMVERIAGGKALPGEVVEQIVARTDGVPLFVEELTKMVLESGLLRENERGYELMGPLPPVAIPTTLQDSLAARLDRLATVKLVAQLSATLGRAFPYVLLRAVSTLDEAALKRELDRLVDAELLYQRGVPPEATYIFKHALLQEAAYQSLLKSTRQQYHERIARVMVEQFSGEAAAHPEFVANHYTEAGTIGEAVQWWQRAGQHAVQRASYAEAITHYRKGLRVLESIPVSARRDQSELGLQVELGYALIPVKGWAAAETASAFTRAGELCREVGETPKLFRALWGIAAFHFVRGDQHKAREVADQCLILAQHADDVDALIEAHYLSGIVSFVMGEFAAGRVDLEECVRLYGPDKRDMHAVLYGQDPKASGLNWLAMGLWALGHPDQGLQRARDSLAFVQSMSRPFQLARGLAGVGFVHVYRREPQGRDSHLEAAIALCIEQGFGYFRAVVSAFQGSNLVQLGRMEEGIALMRESVTTLRAFGSELLFTIVFGELATAHASIGQLDHAATALGEGQACVERNGEHWAEAELYRIEGELMMMCEPPDPAGAEARFQKAREVARRQQAKSYELRATTSLARLWRNQGKAAEARAALGEIYTWFTEGLETPDLKDARALLTQLA
jgi:class 3 adenylate cyclase/predicted ATPase